jgi:hypothetical protein
MATEVGRFSRVNRGSLVMIEEVQAASHFAWYGKLCRSSECPSARCKSCSVLMI